MTTEDSFHLALDENYDDFTTRLVLADYLKEIEDSREMGYRALVACGRYVYRVPKYGQGCPYWERARDGFSDRAYLLPTDWFDCIVLEGKEGYFCPYWERKMDLTRQEVEDVAALAFLLLTPARQQELLEGKL